MNPKDIGGAFGEASRIIAEANKASAAAKLTEGFLDTQRVLGNLTPQVRGLSAIDEMVKSSALERVVHNSIALDMAREASILAQGYSGFDIAADFARSANRAFAELGRGAAMRAFEVLPEWLTVTQQLDQDLRSIAPWQRELADITKSISFAPDVTRMFASISDVARTVGEVQHAWHETITPLASIEGIWKDVAQLTAAANRTWSGLADFPAQLATMRPSLVRAPGLELYLAAKATSLLSSDDDLFNEVNSEIAEADVAIIVDGFEARLTAFDPKLWSMYLGGVERITQEGTDWPRQALISFRSLVEHLLHDLAPDVEMLPWAKEHHFDKGKLTRRARLEFIFRNVDHGDFGGFMRKDYSAAVNLFELLNKVHKKAPDLTKPQFELLRNRIQGFVNMLLEASGN